jgi:hypothetical protein
MELFIQMRDGQPYQHPIFGNNFREAFPHIDVNNLPPEFARFERIEQPTPGVFEVVEGVTYQLVNGVVKDVWVVRSMNTLEKQFKTDVLISDANKTIMLLKERATVNSTTASTETEKTAWLEYIEVLNAWTLVDVLQPNIPRPPRFAADGSVLTLNAEGRPPNVIG